MTEPRMQRGLSAKKKALLEKLLQAEGLAEEAAEAGRPGRIRPRADTSAPVPLSCSQQRVWLLEQFLQDTPVYNVPAPVRLEGPLDVPALKHALQQVVARHEILRTTFAEVDGSPVQVVAPELELALDEVDLAGQGLAFDAVLELVNAEYRRTFDLQRGPLLRARLWRLGPEEHVFLLSFHHAISDGVTLGVLFEEIEAFYAAELEGRTCPLEEPELQMSDYAAWQAEWLDSDEIRAELDFWQDRLRGELPKLELATDRQRGTSQTFAGAWITRGLCSALWAHIQQRARASSGTPFMVILAAFQAFLQRMSDQGEVLVGTPVAMRNRVELERLPGFLVNTVVIRTPFAPDATFASVLAHVRQECVEAFSHQDVPFELVVERVQPERDLSRTPIFQVMYDHRRFNASGLQLKGLSNSRFLMEHEVHSGTTKLDLALYTEERDGHAIAALEYNTDLFDAVTMERFLARFETFLSAALKNPDAKISSLPVLSPTERELLLRTWNATATDYPGDSTIHEQVALRGAERPEAIALEFGDEKLTYAELNARANRLANHLIGEANVRAGDIVGLSVERSNELIVAMLGILRAGGAYLPLDPNYPADRLAFMLQDSGARVLVTQDALVDALPCDGVRAVCVDGHATAIAACRDTDPAVELDSRSPAYVIYTSGSTGKPKGVAVPHQGVMRLHFGSDWLQLDDTLRMIHLAPVSFDASVLDIWGGLLHGGCIVPYPERVPTIEVLAREIEEHSINSLFLTTALFNTIVDEAPEILAGVRQIATGGEAMSSAHVRRAREFWPELELINCYGPTEGSVIATSYRLPAELPAELGVVPIGMPLGNTSVYVLDERMRPVPIGWPGELYMGGPGVALGYLNRPELTAERFVADPFSPTPGARLYRTGDLVRWNAAGAVEFLGRNDDQVKIRGHRIELGEIENRIAALEGVRKAIVLAREDTPGDKRLVAYVVCEDAGASGTELRTRLGRGLPEYMLPSAVLVLDAFPLTAGGKIDRRALPAPELGDSDRSIRAPGTPLEELVHAQWISVLKLAEAGVEDDFFASGGHSLTATVLLARLRSKLEVDVPLRDFFQEPTVRGLVRRIEDLRSAGAPSIPPLVAGASTEIGPLSFNQQGIWYLQQLAPHSPFYSVPVGIDLSGPLDVDAFRRCVRELVRRHDALRLCFGKQSGAPRAMPADPNDFELELLELDTEQLAEFEARFARAPFDLERGPLFRAALVRLAPDHARFLWNVHHIVFDGWSMDVFMRDLCALYAAHSGPDDAKPQLPQLEASYADYVDWQRSWLTGERWEEELGFWREALAGAPPLLELPTDRARPDVPTWSGRSERMRLDPGLAGDLRAFCQREGVTPFMALLAAAQTLLYRFSGQDDFVLGTPVAGRSQPATEDAIGLFLNMVALRSRLDDDPTFEELVRRARETTLSAYAHQDFPFDALVEALAPERNLSHTPVYQVLFSLRHPGQELEAGDLTFAPPHELTTRTVKTDLSITVDDDGQELVLDLAYAEDLFDVTTIQRLGRSFENLLRSAIETPTERVSDLDLLDAADRQRLLVDWNGARPEFPQTSVAHAFHAAVQRDPDAVAVILGEDRLTYGELDRRSNQVASFLRERGVGPNTCVTLCLDRSHELIVCIIGILKAGGAFVPLDPAYPQERLAFMLEDTSSPVLFVHSHLIKDLPEHDLDTLVVDRDWDVIEACSDEPVPLVSKLDDLAYVMYTSGSTGRPKGVEVPHRGILRLVFGADFAHLGPDVTILQLAPVSFDASTLELWGSLLHGGRLVLYPERIPTPEALEKALKENQVTTLWLTAALFNAIVDEAPQALSGLKEILTGGEALSVAHIQRAYAELPETVQLINGYGPTENTTFTCCHRIPRDLPASVRSIPIGRPIANTTVYVLDEKLQLVPPGVPGELYTGGHGLARGYLDRPELTGERFVPDPFSSGRLYKTGDLVRHLPDGTLEFLGRNDFQVKIRGFRIELGEIENALSDHAEVEKSVVVVHEAAGSGKRLVGYVVRRANATVDESSLSEHLRERLPDYMVPALIQFLDEMPITANGKVDRRALPEPDFSSRPEATAAGTLPRNEVELHLARIWEGVLGVERIRVDDDFFDLGGHSLMAVRLLNEVKDVFGQELPLTSLINAPTIAAQAQALHQGVGSLESSALVKIQPKGTQPPIFCVCSLGGTVLNQRPLAMRMGDDQPFYGLQAVNLEDKLGRFASIEDYAAHYIEVMREVCPEGPYVVGGHSFGGVVSYEIARQLLERGLEVRMLFILDSALPNLGKSSIRDHMGSILAFLRGLPHVPAEALDRMRRDPEQFARDLRQKLRFVSRRLAGGKGDEAPAPASAPTPTPTPEEQPGVTYARNSGLQPQDIVEMSHWPENNRKIAERHYRAVLQYEPPPYPGRITLFRSRFQSPFLGLGFQMGWERVARGGVHVRPVPGGHLTILAPPHVDALAHSLREALEASRQARRSA